MKQQSNPVANSEDQVTQSNMNNEEQKEVRIQKIRQNSESHPPPSNKKTGVILKTNLFKDLS